MGSVRDGGGPRSPPAKKGWTGPGPTPPTDAWLLALVLKLLKMATGMRALLDTVVQALPQVGQQPRPGPASLPRGRTLQMPLGAQGAGGPHWVVRSHSPRSCENCGNQPACAGSNSVARAEKGRALSGSWPLWGRLETSAPSPIQFWMWWAEDLAPMGLSEFRGPRVGHGSHSSLEPTQALRPHFLHLWPRS